MGSTIGIRVAVPAEDTDPVERDWVIWKQRATLYTTYLKGLKDNVGQRLKLNDCPKAELTDFAIQGLLGSGGFGKVYQVLEIHTQRKYAMKVQLKQKFVSQRAIETVIGEKKFHWALQSRFILKAISAFQDSACLYLVLPHMEFGDLSSMCGSKQKASEKCIMYMAAQMVLALEYMHCAGIIHRDMKPDNVLINKEYWLKISDLGLATILDKRAFTFVGTLEYMAPEMFSGKGYGSAVDWWALGIILFELTYGRPPSFRVDGRRVPIFPPSLKKEKSINSFISALLVDDPDQRLGSGGNTAELVKNHAYFHYVYFFDVADKYIRFEGNIERVKFKQIEVLQEPFDISGELPSPNPFEEF